MTSGPAIEGARSSIAFGSPLETLAYQSCDAPGLAIVFNGCLYNHVQIRRDAVSRGRFFASSHSDTESILHAIALDGERAFAQFDGMYALAALDALQDRLFLARDRYGEKPLYLLSMHDPRLGHIHAFASSPAPLARLRANITAISPRDAIEPWLLDEWICRGWSGTPPFTQVTEVQPGECLSIDLRTGHASGSRISSPGAEPGQYGVDLDELDRCIVQSVRSRLDADVPVGCFLSGGVDSAVVAAIASKFRPSVPVFTVRMPDPEFDESAAAAHTARALNLHHTILDCETNLLADLTSMIEKILLPLGDSSLLPTFWVSREARRQVTVALTGDGGDELFLGYDRHRAVRLMPIMKRAGLGRLSRWLPAASSSRRMARAARLLQAVAANDYADLVRIFPARVARELGLQHADRAVPLDSISGMLEAARRWDLTQYLPFDLLRKVDTASMAVALESRAPLLSRELGEIVGRISAETLRREGPKSILKKVGARHVPAEVLRRPKRGFAIPIGRWFREDRGGILTALRDLQSSHDSFIAGWQHAAAPAGTWRRLVENHVNHRADHSQRLYHMLVLELWWRSARS
jgi:asparagine synthase (glutamine-hydrolysing)